MYEERGFHMTAEEFRRHGREVVDWIADYWERVESLPVLSRVQPGDISAALPDRPPAHGEPFETILRDVETVIMPGVTHWQSPNFFAFFPANCLRSGGARRAALRRPRGAGDALGNQPGVHGARDPRPRLDGGDARPPGGLHVGGMPAAA